MDSDKKHITLLVWTLIGGGVEHVTLKIASEYQADGHRVDLVYMSGLDRHKTEVPNGVRLFDLGSLYLTRSIRSFVRYVNENKPDVVIAATLMPNIVAVLGRVLSRGNFRVFVAQHGWGDLEHVVNASGGGPARGLRNNFRSRLLRRIAGYVYRKADGVVAVSPSLLGRLKACGLHSRRPVVILNPVWDASKVHLAREAFDHPWVNEDVSLVCGVGRLSVEKNFDDLISAFALLKSEKARLIIVGDGDQRGKLETLVRRLGVEGRVYMPGFTNNPYALMAKASVLVLSSRTEGLPTVLIEALGCGTPVVSTDYAGGDVRDIVSSDQYGKIVAVGDVTAMANAIEQTFREDVDEDVLRRRAEDFSVERSMAKYRELVA